MYLKHFGFQQPPFAINPDPRFLYLSLKHQEALAHLLYGLGEGGGFVMLSGEVGTGKTTLCFTLLEHMGDNVDVALILNPTLNSQELLAALCDELHIEYPRAPESRKLLVDRLNEFLLANHARGRRTVVVIDEAQNLSVEVMEQIRLLTNLETPTTKLLQIVLVGQPELPALLARSDLRQVDQRITARYHLASLDAVEARNYIVHRLSVAGGSPDVFSGAAIRTVWRLSRGVPRLINVICDRALLGAFSGDRKTVDRRTVEKAYREAYDRCVPRNWISGAAAALFVGLAGASLFTLWPGLRGGDVLAVSSVDDGSKNAVAVSPPELSAGAGAEVASETAAAVVVPVAQETPVVDAATNPKFSTWVDDPAHTQAAALGRLLRRWRPGDPLTVKDCEQVKARGLRCLRQHGDWEALRKQNLPSILAIRSAGRAEHWILLTGISDVEAEFLDEEEKTVKFSPLEVLSHWAGESLVLWEPPSNRTIIAPGMTHPAVLWLRERLRGAGYESEPAGAAQFFDVPLRSALMRFQENRGIPVDGVAGEKTLAALSGIRSGNRILSLSQHSNR